MCVYTKKRKIRPLFKIDECTLPVESMFLFKKKKLKTTVVIVGELTLWCHHDGLCSMAAEVSIGSQREVGCWSNWKSRGPFSYSSF